MSNHIRIRAQLRDPINLDQLAATLLALVDELDAATQDHLVAEGAKIRAAMTAKATKSEATGGAAA